MSQNPAGNIISELLREVDDEVRAANDQIVLAAFERINNTAKLRSRNCGDCDCSYNPKEFQRILHDFTETRKELHRNRKALRFHYGNGGTYDQTARHIERDCDKLRQEATMLRHHLERVAPCLAWIAVVNPTGRTRPSRLWIPDRRRAYKEAVL